MVITLRCRHPYDVFWMHEQTEEIARDTLFRGTALSAWVSKLVLQAALTAVVAARLGRRGHNKPSVPWGPYWRLGTLGDWLVRQRLRPSG
jgi:hypothetical protein